MTKAERTEKKMRYNIGKYLDVLAKRGVKLTYFVHPPKA